MYVKYQGSLFTKRLHLCLRNPPAFLRKQKGGAGKPAAIFAIVFLDCLTVPAKSVRFLASVVQFVLVLVDPAVLLRETKQRGLRRL